MNNQAGAACCRARLTAEGAADYLNVLAAQRGAVLASQTSPQC